MTSQTDSADSSSSSVNVVLERELFRTLQKTSRYYERMTIRDADDIVRDKVAIPTSRALQVALEQKMHRTIFGRSQFEDTPSPISMLWQTLMGSPSQLEQFTTQGHDYRADRNHAIGSVQMLARLDLEISSDSNGNFPINLEYADLPPDENAVQKDVARWAEQNIIVNAEKTYDPRSATLTGLCIKKK